jgi:hypothetical protein
MNTLDIVGKIVSLSLFPLACCLYLALYVKIKGSKVDQLAILILSLYMICFMSNFVYSFFSE